MKDTELAVAFGMAVIDLERECPRGYDAAHHSFSHSNNYIHMKTKGDGKSFCCIKTTYEARMEYGEELFCYPTEAQIRFWNARSEWYESKGLIP